MWLILGVASIFFAVMNIVRTLQNKDAKWFAFVSLALTALTLCAFYSDGAIRVVNEDWGGLMDIMPTMSKALWVCTIVSIAINSIPLFREKKL
ncbi:MAG: hypothetical protein GX091_06960 [Peptococcaceae bacterium]|nr:hypothetical protein [Peptococcaceae bacterium]